MSTTNPPVDVKSAEDHLMRFLAIEGLSGKEKVIGEAVIDELKKVGVPASAIRFDKVNERIPVPTQTGNLFVDLPGTPYRLLWEAGETGSYRTLAAYEPATGTLVVMMDNAGTRPDAMAETARGLMRELLGIR